MIRREDKPLQLSAVWN